MTLVCSLQSHKLLQQRHYRSARVNDGNDEPGVTRCLQQWLCRHDSDRHSHWNDRSHVSTTVTVVIPFESCDTASPGGTCHLSCLFTWVLCLCSEIDLNDNALTGSISAILTVLTALGYVLDSEDGGSVNSRQEWLTYVRTWS